jgi:MoaA/NifB/PqqE/SkfB family radical SAM enzyme
MAGGFGMSKDMIRQWTDKYNSFNPWKALVHLQYWKPIIDAHRVPPPLFVSVDPCGACNLRCPHCNAQKVIGSTGMMTLETVDKLVSLLSMWGVKSVCIGGGGEPFLNPNTYNLINRLVDRRIQVAAVTNGTTLNEADLVTLIRCEYFGISVDAASDPTWQKIKGTKKIHIQDIFEGISRITDRGLDVTYKFLLSPANYTEVYDACKIARHLGCNNFHLRPVGAPWFELGRKYEYTDAMRASVGEQVDKARADLETDAFKIHAVVAKFDDHWQRKVDFEKCWACMTTCVIDPRGKLSLCCDGRGNPKYDLCDIGDADAVWGSADHWKIQEAIHPKSCARCTFAHVSEAFEAFLLSDKTFQNFF